MKNTTLKKTIVIMVLILTISIICAPLVYGEVLDLSRYPRPGMTDPGDRFKIMVDTIFGLLNVVGVIISVIVISIIGIKYMVGSVEEKAEYKKTLVPFIIGAVIFFATTGLVQIIYNWSINLDSSYDGGLDQDPDDGGLEQELDDGGLTQ